MSENLINNNGTVYLLLFGEYWPIADWNTLKGVFGENAEITDKPITPTPLGPTVSPGSFIWRDGEKIEFMCTSNNTLYHIDSDKTKSFYQFNGDPKFCDAVFRQWVRNGAKVGREIT